MEPDNKIYIVVAVLAVILAGIFVYLFVMDRKITRMEKELKEHEEKKPGEIYHDRGEVV
ncbi:MAG: CcmD family protein [Bacteroidetes bacterium]|nr:MAG: CcmD family protein [Bacteroidota bacterium]